MKPDLASFPDLIEVDSDGPEVASDPLAKFFSNAECAGALHHPRGFAFIEGVHAEATERNARVTAAYAKIAEAAAPKVAPAPASNTLAKSARKIVSGRADDTRKVLRTETTKYPLTRTALIAEIAETGEVIRVWEETE